MKKISVILLAFLVFILHISSISAENKVNKIETKDTYAIHWYTQNWNMSRKGYVFINTKHIKNPVRRFVAVLKKNLGYISFYFTLMTHQK